mmetsp:Transcript_32555/g.82012  ORF Transcript_32555/g.82012 Transcript_32555/m.82012 type:complete len:228 (-) Transcript_32555:941-1624(-)
MRRGEHDTAAASAFARPAASAASAPPEVLNASLTPACQAPKVMPPECVGCTAEGGGSTMRPNHARDAPAPAPASARSDSDISWEGTAMSGGGSVAGAATNGPEGLGAGGGGSHARAASPSITTRESGGSSGDRPPRVSPRDPKASCSSSSSASWLTRSAGVMTMATPTSVCSPLPRKPGEASSSSAAAATLPSVLSPPLSPLLPWPAPEEDVELGGVTSCVGIRPVG